jgi:hypothetical protein
MSVIYEAGTADSDQQGGFAGTAFGGSGIHSISGGYRSKGRIETRLAQRVAPPHLDSPGDYYIRVAILVSLTCLGLAAVCGLLIYWGLPIPILLIFMVGFALWAIAKREKENRWYQTHIYQPQLEQWKQSYYCLRCGHPFIP